MARKAQDTIDGYTINFHRARMSGTFDLEDRDAEHFITGDVLVGVFVAKIEGPSIKENKQGDITRTDVARVSEVKILTGELKSVLVKQLGLYGPDTDTVKSSASPLAQGNPNAATTESPAYFVTVEDGETITTPVEIPPNEDDTYEPHAEEDEEPEDGRVWVPTDVEVIGVVGNQNPVPNAGTNSPGGPRVLAFVDRDGSVPMGERETLGRIASGDKLLQKAMGEGGWE